jgi:hypothetical protein
VIVDGCMVSVIVFTHDSTWLRLTRSSEGSTRTTRAHAEAEADHASDSEYKIVLIGSDSIETIMRAHGHHFSSEKDDLLAHLDYADAIA